METNTDLITSTDDLEALRDGIGHGRACYNRNLPFDRQSIADDPHDPFMRGYVYGYMDEANLYALEGVRRPTVLLAEGVTL